MNRLQFAAAGAGVFAFLAVALCYFNFGAQRRQIPPGLLNIEPNPSGQVVLRVDGRVLSFPKGVRVMRAGMDVYSLIAYIGEDGISWDPPAVGVAPANKRLVRISIDATYAGAPDLSYELTKDWNGNLLKASRNSMLLLIPARSGMGDAFVRCNLHKDGLKRISSGEQFSESIGHCRLYVHLGGNVKVLFQDFPKDLLFSSNKSVLNISRDILMITMKDMYCRAVCARHGCVASTSQCECCPQLVDSRSTSPFMCESELACDGIFAARRACILHENMLHMHDGT